jgi:hypothetical protein
VVTSTETPGGVTPSPTQTESAPSTATLTASPTLAQATASASPSPSVGQGSAQAGSSSQAIIVDRHSVELFEQIPDEYLAAARELRMVYADRSVG